MKETANVQLTANRLVLLLSLLILAGGLAALSWTFTSGRNQPPVANLGGPFSLIDQNGRTVDQTILAGKPTLLFFGYTHCPDICPTRLYEMAQFVARMGPQGKRLNVVFASVDPERDTPDLLKGYLSGFSDDFIGLTGSSQAVAAFARSWRAFYRKVGDTPDSYSMDHTAAIYVLDKKSAFVALIDIEKAPDKAMALLLTLL